MKKRIFTALLAFLIVVLSAVHSGAQTKNVFRANRAAHGKVALTFDDGPHPRYTHAILEVLREYGVSATFFVIGVNVENYPEAFCEIVESGCEIGNHTYSHKNVTAMSIDEIGRELDMTEAAIMKHTDKRPTLFRPPQGAYDARAEEISLSRGYDIILWSIDTLDWAHTPPDKISASVVSSLDNGDIILMHDYTSNGNSAPAALRVIIPHLLELGYEFVTVSELIGEE